MIKKILIIGLAVSGLAVSQTELLHEDNPVRRIDYYFPENHYCIALKCGITIDKCKTIKEVLTPFCDKHIQMIRDYKVFDVCSRSYGFYVKQCKENKDD